MASGRAKALYVLDPGPDGSLGERHGLCRLVRRRSVLLVVQGSDVNSAAADFSRGSCVGERTRSTPTIGGKARREPSRRRERNEDWQILQQSDAAGPVASLSDKWHARGDRKYSALAYAEADKVPFHASCSGPKPAAGVQPSERCADFLSRLRLKGHNVQMEKRRCVPLPPVG